MNKYALGLFFILVLITPSIFFIGFTDVFEFPKVYFITILLCVINTLNIKNIKKISLGRLDLILLFYVSLNWISACFSKDFYTSIFGYWGNPVSSVLFITSIVFFIILNKESIKVLKIKNLHNLLLISGLPTIIYGYLQLFGKDIIDWETGIKTIRVFSTFGQPNFFALYLSVLLLICVFRFLGTKRKVYLLYGVLVLVLYIKTQSLSSFISLGFLLSMYICFFGLKKKFSIFSSSFFLFLLLTGLIVFFAYPRLLNQVSNKSGFTDDTAKIRLILWKNALNQSFKPKTLIIGNGPDNFAFNFIRPVELNKTSEWGLVFSKPHNLFIEQLFSLGFFGLSIYIYFTFCAFKSFKQKNENFIPLLLLISSFFLWIPSFLFFIFYICLTISQDSKIFYTLRLSIFQKAIVVLALTALFMLSAVYVLTNYMSTGENGGCFAYNIFPNYQPYSFTCGNKSNNDSLMKKAYLLNPDNKVYVEKTGLYFLNKKDTYGEYIFEKSLEKNQNDPVYIYYFGLSKEIFGDSKSALFYYKEARFRSHNFYQNDKAINRITKSN